MLRRSLIVVVAFAAVLALAASGGAARHAAAFPVTIHAANGDVVIQKRPTRVISLSPTGTEDLFAVGAGSQVIAVDNDSDYPKNAPHSTLSGYTPNVEAIAGYKPDLVVVSNDIGGIVGALQKLGITVLLEPAADNVAQAYDEIRQIGQATGHTPQATTVVHGMETSLTKILRSVPKSNRHLTVYAELDPTYYSATSSTFIGRIFKLFGFREHRRCGGHDPLRIPAALGRVHRVVEPRHRRPRRQRCAAANRRRRSRRGPVGAGSRPRSTDASSP